MLEVRLNRAARRALERHRNVAAHILTKIEAYAADPASQAGNAKRLAGEPTFRLRVGDFRVLFELEANVMTVTDIGPRGRIYRR